MKISKETKLIFRNFADIQQNLYIRPGNVIMTKNGGKEPTVAAKATIKESFEAEFPIYDLPQFNSVLGLFNDPEVDLTKECAVVREGRQQQRFFYSDPRMLTFPNRVPAIPGYELEFQMKAEDFKRLEKAAAINRVESIVIESDGTLLKVSALDVDTVTGEVRTENNSFSIEYEDVDVAGKAFSLVLDLKDFRLVLPDLGDYQTRIMFEPAPVVNFKNDVLEYWVSVQRTSAA